MISLTVQCHFQALYLLAIVFLVNVHNNEGFVLEDVLELAELHGRVWPLRSYFIWAYLLRQF